MFIYVFYLDGDNKYFLVKNKINKIYELKLNNKVYYYPTHNALMNQLKSYLSSVAERVAYEN